jgi:uncharacterized protein (TIGR03000 family)
MGVTARNFRFGVLALVLGGLSALVAPMARAEDKTAVLVVKLPADAQLEIGGYKSKQTGEVRKFESPALAPGKKYSYALKATWMVDGKEVVRETKVWVSSGQTEEVDVRQLPDKTAEKIPDKTLDKNPDKTADKTPDKTPDKIPDKTAEKIPDKTPDKTPDRTADKTPDKTPDKAPVKTPAKPSVASQEATPPSPPKAATLTVQLPTDLELETGGKKTIPVKVIREGFEGPVTVKLQGLPGSDKPLEVLIPAEKTEGTAEIVIDKTASEGSVDLKVLASGGKATAEGQIKLTVKAPPKPALLTLDLPATVEVTSGDKTVIPVKVVRESFEGPVKVKFAGVPDGGRLPELTIPPGQSEGSVELALAKETKEGTYEVKAAAVGGTAKGEATTRLKVIKLSKVAALQLSTPPVLNLQVGGFAKLLPITVAREGFEGPVTLKFEGLPAGVTISDMTVPADKDKVYAETAVTDSADAGEMDIKVVAVAEMGKAELTLKLKITKR